MVDEPVEPFIKAMQTKVKRAKSRSVRGRGTALAKITEKEVSAVLAQTDWAKYWRDVAELARPELQAYDRAMVASLADAATKFVRQAAN